MCGRIASDFLSLIALQGSRTLFPVLAKHAKEAEEHELAHQYYMKAGNTALAAFQNDEAAAFFTEALALVPKTSVKGTLEHVSLERKLGLAYLDQGVTDKAQEHLRSGLSMLGITLPPVDTPSSKLKLKFKAPKDLDWPAKTEAVLAAVALARIFYYDCARSLTQFTVYAALKLAKGNEQLLEECYPVCIMLHSTRKEFLAPQAYIDLCVASSKPGLKMPVSCRFH